MSHIDRNDIDLDGRKPRSHPRKTQMIVNDADHAELERHYRFVPGNNDSSRAQSNWQTRMTERYQSHLYRDRVVADLTRSRQQQIGLRWRTQAEVSHDRGKTTCGNKHCPSFLASKSETESNDRQNVLAMFIESTNTLSNNEDAFVQCIADLAFGQLQHDYEVPFTYREGGSNKTELVTLRLCARCAPKLYEAQGHAKPTLAAVKALLGAQFDAERANDSRRRRKSSQRAHEQSSKGKKSKTA